jgi:hypothetical protein
VFDTSSRAATLLTMERIVFVSLFLGLVSGTQWVEMRADPEVKTIRITLGAREVAVLGEAPWQTAIDFGGLEPNELVATGLNDRQEAVSSASQFLNLPRPVAEVEMVLHREQDMPAAVSLVWHHREQKRPKRVSIAIDGKPLRIGKDFTARLPPFDVEHSHVLSAEMQFVDGVVARCDLVLRGGFSDESGSQLTPIVLTGSSPQTPETLDGCLTLNGEAVRSTASESTDALVIIVKDPDPFEAQKVLMARSSIVRRDPKPGAAIQDRLDSDTAARILWPVASQIVKRGEPSTKLFRQTNDQPSSEGGMRSLLTQTFSRTAGRAPRQFADGVAVAGVRAMASGRRRAVILLLSRTADASHYTPAEVRRYLAAIGVPLFVWSLNGPRADLVDTWGAVDDISTNETLQLAIDRLRATLKNQRVAWVALDPLRALRVQSSERCAVTPLARLSERR